MDGIKTRFFEIALPLAICGGFEAVVRLTLPYGVLLIPVVILGGGIYLTARERRLHRILPSALQRRPQMDWSEIVRKAISLGEATGYLTFAQINDLITEPKAVEPEDIDVLLTTLSNSGINVVDE
jgi:hypothetical protein